MDQVTTSGVTSSIPLLDIEPNAGPVAPRGLREVAPGVALCGAVTLGALALQAVERRVSGHVWLESLVLAIVLGAAVRTAWTPGPMWRPGVEFSAKTLLEIAVALLGASVSAAALLSVGPALLAGIAVVVLVSLGASFGLGRLLGLSPRLALLVACGNSICGNSAIAAVAPVIGADGEEVAASIGFTAVLGVGVVVGLPALGAALHMSGLQFGALAGLTVYAVPQVLAATSPLGVAAMQFGTLVKLVRVMMLGPICFGLSLLATRLRAEPDEAAPAVTAGERGAPHRLVLTRLAPWFILGFLALMAMRSLGWVPSAAAPVIAATTTLLTIVSMAALGLGTDVRMVARSGMKVSAAVVLSLATLGTASVLLIRCLRIA